MIFSDRDWIFIHIQKTGGTAVRAALGVELHDAHKHFLARELREIYGQPAWQQRFKFAFVRNPWDRLVSWWSMIDGLREQFRVSGPPNNFTDYVLRQAHTFEQFITCCTDEIVDSDGRKHIFRNQIDYLTDENGLEIVDFVGRFEHLQDSFNVVADRLGLARSQLPRINASRHNGYVEYYSSAMAETVGRLYARDVERFGYRFGR